MCERLHYGGRPTLRLDGRSAGAGWGGCSAVVTRRGGAGRDGEREGEAGGRGGRERGDDGVL